MKGEIILGAIKYWDIVQARSKGNGHSKIRGFAISRSQFKNFTKSLKLTCHSHGILDAEKL